MVNKNGPHFHIESQPTDSSCGPTCLHAVYRYYGERISLQKVLTEVKKLPDGGTLAVLLGNHALKRGYRAKLYTLNLNVFDPSWFQKPGLDLSQLLKKQIKAKKNNHQLVTACRSYLDFIELGGVISMVDFSDSLVKRHLQRKEPILAGLSATYLYQCPREYGDPMDYDSVRGVPQGHGGAQAHGQVITDNHAPITRKGVFPIEAAHRVSAANGEAILRRQRCLVPLCL